MAAINSGTLVDYYSSIRIEADYRTASRNGKHRAPLCVFAPLFVIRTKLPDLRWGKSSRPLTLVESDAEVQDFMDMKDTLFFEATSLEECEEKLSKHTVPYVFSLLGSILGEFDRPLLILSEGTIRLLAEVDLIYKVERKRDKCILYGKKWVDAIIAGTKSSPELDKWTNEMDTALKALTYGLARDIENEKSAQYAGAMRCVMSGLLDIVYYVAMQEFPWLHVPREMLWEIGGVHLTSKRTRSVIMQLARAFGPRLIGFHQSFLDRYKQEHFLEDLAIQFLATILTSGNGLMWTQDNNIDAVYKRRDYKCYVEEYNKCTQQAMINFVPSTIDCP